MRLKNNMAKEVLIYVSCFWKTTVGVSLCHWIPTPKQVKKLFLSAIFVCQFCFFFQSLPFWRTASSPVLQANVVSDGFFSTPKILGVSWTHV